MAIHWSNARLITFLDKIDPSAPTLVSQLMTEIQVSADYGGPLPDGRSTVDDTDLYDFSLSLSSSLRNCKANEEQQFFPSLIITMLGALLKNCWPDSVVIDDPLVALPRHPMKDYDPLLRFSTYRRAQLLLFAYIEARSDSDVETSDGDLEQVVLEEDDTRPYTSARRMTVSEFCTEDYFRSCRESPISSSSESGNKISTTLFSQVGELEDAESSARRMTASKFCAEDDFRSCRESPTSSRAESGIKTSIALLSQVGKLEAAEERNQDESLQGSMLTGRYAYLYLMGVICAGTNGSIWGTTASMLYQRRSWGIDQPVFSLVLDEQTTEVSVVVSWLSDDTHSTDLPNILATYLARYDLSVPAQSFELACFIRRLDSHVTEMQTLFENVVQSWSLEDVVPPFLSWRADTFSQTFADRDSFWGDTTNIQNWVQSCARDNLNEYSLVPSTIGSSSMLEQGQGVQVEEINSGPRGLVSPRHSVEGPDGAALNSLNTTFCNGTNGRIAQYLGQRNIFPMVHPFGHINNIPIPGERLNKHAKDFNRFTAIPKDAILNLIAAKTVSQWGEPLRRECAALKQTLCSDKLEFATSDAVDESIMSMISNGFETFLYISIRARQQAQDVYRLTLPEVAVRRQWDILMMEATSNMKELNIDTAVEQTIRLPQNTNLEAVRAKGSLVNDAQISGHSTWRKLILDVRNSDFMKDVGRLGPDGKWRKDLPTIIYDSLITYHSKHYEMEKDEGNIRDMQSKEPQQTRCDCIVSLSVQVFDAPPESASQRKCIEHLRKLALVDLAACAAPGDSQIGKVSDMTLSVENNDIMQSSRTKIPMIQGREKEGPGENVDEDEGNDELPPSESVDALHLSDQILAVKQEDPVHPFLEPEMLEAKSESKKCITSGDLKLPLLVQEHERFLSDDDKKGNAVNQARLNIAASLKFLAALGIYDFSVYTIATDGTRGTLCYGYMEQGKDGQPDVGYIYEHNTRAFNIASPLDVFNLAITLGHICVENGKVLRDKFALIAGELKNDLEDTQITSKRFWTAETQNNSMRAGFFLR